jgi:hypothetical protein
MSTLRITRDALERRPVRPIQSTFFNSIQVNLEYREAGEPGTALPGLPWAVMEATGAQSAGLSLLDGDAGVCWSAVSGRWAANAGRRFSLRDLPCSAAMDAGELLLLLAPASAYPALASLSPGIAEGMYAPVLREGRVAGVLWALAHDTRLQFDSQDAFMLAELAAMAGRLRWDRSVAGHQG